jgi:Erv1 / Alr family
MADLIVTCGDSYNQHIFPITEEQLRDAVRRAHDLKDPDSNNGLITKIWGPPSWESFHAIQYGYPIEPTQQEMEDYFNYFTFLGKVLPCIFCRDSYQDFTAPGGDCALTMEIMKSREALTKWGHRLHDRVNQKLGVDYKLTYEELCYKYESYRAKCTKTGKGCIMPLDMKSKSYQNADIKRAPVIDPFYSEVLIPHARTLGLDNYETMLNRTKNLERNSEAWMVRDIMATKVIKHMRVNGISSLDESGLPSQHEMILLALLSTSLEKEKLDEIASMVSNVSSAK